MRKTRSAKSVQDDWDRSWRRHWSKVGLPGYELPVRGPGQRDREFLSQSRTPAEEIARLKRLNDEFKRWFKALYPLGPAVTVFGSARSKEDHPYYRLARAARAELARAGSVTLTGGGRGIMEAANRGAREAGGASVEFNIILPHEQRHQPLCQSNPAWFAVGRYSSASTVGWFRRERDCIRRECPTFCEKVIGTCQKSRTGNAVPLQARRTSVTWEAAVPMLRVLLLALAASVLWVAGQAKAFAQLLPAAVAVGEASATNTAVPLPGTASIETKLAQARANLAAAEAMGDRAVTNVPVGIPPEDIAARRALLDRIVRLYEQQLSNSPELEQVKNRRAEVARLAKTWIRFTERPPYSILLTDRLRQEIQTEQLKIASAESAVTALDELAQENGVTLARAEEKVRQLDEQLEGGKNPAAAARLSWLRDLERLRSQVAAASAGVLESERQLRQENLAESRVRLGWLQRQLAAAEPEAVFSHADLELVIARIEGESREIERELNAAQSQSRASLDALETAQSELRQAEAGRGTGRAAAVARATEKVSACEAKLANTHAAVRTLRLLLETESVERAMWETRFAAHGSRSVTTLNDSEKRLKSFIRRSELWKAYQQGELELLPSEIELQQTRLRNLPPDSDLVPLARERLAGLRERDQLLLRLVRRIDHVQRLGQRWAEGIREAERQLPLAGRAQNLFSGAGSFLRRLWSFELFTAEDTIEVEGQKITGRRSITLGKLIMAVLILTLGIWITGLISRIAEPVIIRRLKIEPNEANLIRRWLRAFMILCLVVFSLLSVKIPLTVFAFAGGALAIGLGFGMQTLLKNFVSGLILLFERPFRVGDVLEVGDQRGTVTEIGLRSSVLQLWDGTETLIPNSTLLENNVSNWTYSNRKVRFSVTVGVAYGSDTRRVIQLLTEVAERHGVLEKDPKPQVLFTDFADSALMFELRYWVNVITANAAQVGSDLRQMIAGTFADNGIVIAFPQRDLHLDATRPLPVEIIPAAVQNQPPSNALPLSAGPTGDSSAPGSHLGCP